MPSRYNVPQDRDIEDPSDDGTPSSPSSGNSSTDSRLAALANRAVPPGSSRHISVRAALSSAHTLCWATFGSIAGLLALTAVKKNESSNDLAHRVEATIDNVVSQLSHNTTVTPSALRSMQSAYRDLPVPSAEPEKPGEVFQEKPETVQSETPERPEGSEAQPESAKHENEAEIEYVQVISAFAAAGVAGEEIFGPIMKKLKQFVGEKIRGLPKEELPHNSQEAWREVLTESLEKLTSSVLTGVATGFIADAAMKKAIGQAAPLDAYAAIVGIGLIVGVKMSPILKLILQSAKEQGVNVIKLVSALTEYMRKYPYRFDPADLKEIGDLSAQVAINIGDASRLHPSPASTRSSSPVPPKRPVADSRPASAPADSRKPIVKVKKLTDEDLLRPTRPESAPPTKRGKGNR